METEIIIAALILLALVFLATIDMAFTQLSDVSLRRLTAESEDEVEKPSVVFLREILDDRPRFRFAISSAIQTLIIVFSVVVTLSASRYFQSTTELLLVSLFLCLSLTVIFRQIIPRLLTSSEPENKLLLLLPWVRPIYGLMSFAFAPFNSFLNAKSNARAELGSGATPTDEENEIASEEFQALIEVGEAEGIIEEEERELIETVVEFGETRAGEIMTPRPEICAIPSDATVKDARDLMISEKYSRLPVYRDAIDNIEGLIYVRDLLNAWSEGRENEPISKLLRPAFCVPETKPARELLKDMQSNHVQLVVVIDEYGGVAGVVSLEDIVEEIVGEIEDEDTEKGEVIEIVKGENGDYFDVLGSTEIEKIEELFDIDIDEEDVTTIAGLVTSDFGYVPKKNEKLDLHGLSVEILKADDKKINLLRIRRAVVKANATDG